MLCENCGKNEATFHYKSNINGEKTESHLCADCVAKLGKEEFFMMPSATDYFDSFLSNVFSEGLPAFTNTGIKRCPLCGASAKDISKTGKVGCAECYDVFSDMLMPYVRRIHGNTHHIGKISAAAKPEVKVKKQIHELKSQLKAAVNEQNFERAAELRDEIKKLEGQA